MLKYLKSNTWFIISLLVLAIIALNPRAKAFLLSGFIKTGLYQPSLTQSSSENTPMAPASMFISSSGEYVDLSRLKGKVVFVNFWATWCPPCIAEMPSINSLKSKYNNDEQLVFLMVDVDNNRTVSETFMKENNYDLPVYTPGGNIPKSLFDGSVPTTAIINKKGEIVFKHAGMANYNSKKMQSFIDDLLRQGL